MFRIFGSTILLILSGLFSLNTFALGANDNAPIKIQSDRAELDNQNGIATYTGDVVMIQGDAKLMADKVIIFSKKNVLVKIEAYGKPAHFSQSKNAKTPKTDAYGNTIIYTKSTQILKLIKSAKLEQARNSFTGEEIEYNTLKGIVNARSNPTAEPAKPGSRVEIEFHPNQIAPKSKK
jgi:lipopolysaccharide export system protein LptA